MISAETQGGRFPRLVQAAIDAFSIPDLRAKILFTLAMLALYRFIAHVSIPGIDPDRVSDLVNNNQLLGFLDLFSGGAFRRMSIVALGVFPYITASIVMQLLTPVVPGLQEMSREGESGRAKMNRMVHWLTVPIALAQGYGQLLLLDQQGILAVGFTGDALLPTLAALLSIVAGTLFLVWLGELITERGIGNGISLIIFAGIVAGFPGLLSQGFVNRDDLLGVGFFAIIGILIIALIVMFNEAHRRIPVQYGRSIFRGGRMYRQSGAHLFTSAYKLGGYDSFDLCLLHRYSAGNRSHLPCHQYGMGGRRGKLLCRPPGAFQAPVLDHGVHPRGNIHLLLHPGGV